MIQKVFILDAQIIKMFIVLRLYMFSVKCFLKNIFPIFWCWYDRISQSNSKHFQLTSKTFLISIKKIKINCKPFFNFDLFFFACILLQFILHRGWRLLEIATYWRSSKSITNRLQILPAYTKSRRAFFTVVRDANCHEQSQSQRWPVQVMSCPSKLARICVACSVEKVEDQMQCQCQCLREER